MRKIKPTRSTLASIFLLLLVLAFIPKLSLADEIPCLEGSGPLLPGQSYCEDSASLFDKDEFDCDPAKPPTDGGCGYPEFVILINRFITWLIIVGFPLAALFIAYGGFVILTSAGSTERVSKGRKIITASIVALLIAGSAYFIIQAIFYTLGVEDKFRNQSLDQELELPN